ATPVLCDVDPHDFNVTLAALEARRTARTKAVIPVHLFGLPVAMGPLLDWAASHGLHVVEDAACGLGAVLDGTHVGRFGACGVFSFHPRKAVTTGEGGMVVCEDAGLADTLRQLRAHGARPPSTPASRPMPEFLRIEYDLLGFNYRLTDLQAALGVGQMRKAAQIQTLRQARAEAYTAALQGLDWLACPAVPAGVTHGWQSYVVRIRPEAFPGRDPDTLIAWRDRLMLALEAAGVSTRPGTHAVSGLALYRERLGVDPLDFPGARAAEGLSLALPLFPTLTDAEQAHVVEQLSVVFGAVGPP
ncbi:MAG: DegT/DnrJ/EryC1/StrS family aminotransferase, partial [Myxococcales bacterium]|nr:DegT/DnrJ/EryC1/StrS family aminotransferase [Myxococcales bacterium]